MQAGHADVLILLLLAACNCYVAAKPQQAVMQDATALESRPVPAPPLEGLNMTCFKLCQLGRLSEAAVLAAALDQSATANCPNTTASGTQHPSQQEPRQPTTSATQQPSQQEPRQATEIGGSSASPAGQCASISTPPGSACRLMAGTVNSTANNTANSTANSTDLVPVTSCAGLDPNDVALLRSRYRAFRTNLALSDFFEIFYSVGNLWYAIVDLLKQALNAFAQGRIEVNAESILLFNANIAGIVAFWGNLVQTILLLKADLTLPVPDELAEGPSSG